MSRPVSSSAALPIAYVVLRILIVVNWLGGAAILALLVGTGLAWINERTNTPFTTLSFALAIIPLVIPGILFTVSWIMLASPKIGLINLALQKLTDSDLTKIKYYRFAPATVDGAKGMISRSGYTGEDGFEIFLSPGDATRVMKKLIDAGVQPCGLGARDTLRLEAKMALYGNDIDHSTTPIEADLGWIVKLEKGDFMGRDVLQRENAEGPKRKLVGFEMVDRGIARHGYPVVDGGEEIGVVTSGTHSPTLKKAIGLAYLPLDKSAPGTEFMVLIRGKETRARVVPTPFYKRAK